MRLFLKLNSVILTFKPTVSPVMTALLTMGCQLVNNQIEGTNGSVSPAPIVSPTPNILPTALSLNLGECYSSPLESLPYLCELNVQQKFSQSSATNTNKVNKLDHRYSLGNGLSADVTYELFDNSCLGLSIDSTGVLQGEILNSESETCVLSVRASSGDLTVEESLSLTIGPSLSMSFDKENLFFQVGAMGSQLKLILSEPAPYNTYMDFEIFGDNTEVLSGLSFNTRRIHISKGQSNVVLDLSVASATTVTSPVYQQLRLLNGSSQDLPGVSLNSYAETTTLPSFEVVAAGGEHSCGIDDGKIYCWGNNSYGQIGATSLIGSVVNRPLQVGVASNWSQIALGGDHSCAINSLSQLFCWGRNSDGQVGIGTSTSSEAMPVRVGLSSNWIAISAGANFTCGIDGGGLYCWGRDSSSELGNGSATATDILTPDRIGISNSWSLVAAGGYHACGVDGGQLNCWGAHSYGQTGNGTASSTNVDDPVPINAPGSWSHLTAGTNSVCGIESGQLFCWGFGVYGQLGNSQSSGSSEFAPAQVGSSNLWTDVSAGGNHTCGFEDGTLYCFGNDEYGQVGDGTDTQSSVIALAQIGIASSWTQVALGGYHTCGIGDNNLYCWGRGSKGQIGNGAGTASRLATPTAVGVSTGWQQLSLSGSHSCGINSGVLHCWGNDSSGQMGNGPESGAHLNTPLPVDNSKLWTIAATGQSHSCAIKSGQLYCWGSDSTGQIGNGGASSLRVYAPELITPTMTLWTQLSLGNKHSCGLHDKNLYCWGSDEFGQIGNGALTTIDIDTPSLISGSNTWTRVSVGATHSCGIDAGKLYCWGSDSDGQIGNGTMLTANQVNPVPIGASAQWSEIAVGDSFTCGIDQGYLFCWGKDNVHQTGNGSSTSDVEDPSQIGLSALWTHVSSSLGHSCGINDSELYCWGYNISDQVGNGLTADAQDPVKINNSSNWTDVSTGELHSCGISTGSLHCWGDDQYGQTGTSSSFLGTPFLLIDW